MVKPADKMLMIPALFDGEKPEKAKMHYEKFNQYIKFQTKEGNIKDTTKEAIELFEYTLDKKVLIWFQQHEVEFTDLTTLKNMFLARYNPWGKTKRDQLQSWNNLSFDPQKTNIDKQIDLVSTLGNMLGQDKQVKMERFIDTMPTIIQTHLIIEPDWADVTKKAKNLEHIIQKCDPPLLPHPFYKVQVQFLAYIHILHNPKIKILTISLSHSKVQKVEEERNQVKANRNLNSSLNHLPFPQKKTNIMKRQMTITIMRIIEAITEAANPTGVNKAAAENLIEVPNKGEGASKTIIGVNTKATVDISTPPMEAITIIIITVIIKAEVDMAVMVIITEVMAMAEAIIEAITITNTTNITHMMMVHRWSNMACHVHFGVI